MTSMIRLEMKNDNMLLTEKQQKNHDYYLEKMINMNILPVKKYCPLIKNEEYSKVMLHILHKEKLLKNKQK